MRRTTRKLARLTMYTGGAVAALVLAFASSLQSAGVPLTDRVMLAVAPSHPAGRLAPNEVRKLPAMVTVDSPEVKVLRSTGAEPRNPAPRYPEMLRASSVEGSVLVRFYTDANGGPDMSTFTVVQSSHDLFTNAVKAVLPKWHLRPNTAVELPFVFTMTDGSGATTIDGVSTANAVVVTAAPLRQGVAVADVPPATKKMMNSEQTYFEFQVEKQATPLPGNPSARYPDVLRQAGIEGEVLAQFVLNPDGTPDMDTFKVLKSTHDLFTESVRAALPNMRFEPALVGGKAVKQLIQMPFQFNLQKDQKPPM